MGAIRLAHMGIEQRALDEKAEKEKELAEAGPKKPEGKTFKEIMADKEQSTLFAEQLRLAGDTTALENWTKGDFGADDTKELDRQVNEFNALMERADDLGKMLDSKDLEKIIASSPDLKRIHGLNKDGIREVVKRYLPGLAVHDHDNFKKIADAMEAREETRKRVAESDKVVEEFCKMHGVSEDEYYEAAGKGMNEVREIAVQDMSLWRRLRENSKQTQDEIARRIAGLPDQAAVSAYIDELERDRKRVGDALAFTLTDNDEMRQAFARETLALGAEKKEGEETEMSFPEAKKALKMTKEDVKKERDTWWSGLDDQERADYEQVGGFEGDDAKSEFRQHLSKKFTKGKKGFFKSFFESVLFPSTLDRLL